MTDQTQESEALDQTPEQEPAPAPAPAPAADDAPPPGIEDMTEEHIAVLKRHGYDPADPSEVPPNDVIDAVFAEVEAAGDKSEDEEEPDEDAEEEEEGDDDDVEDSLDDLDKEDAKEGKKAAKGDTIEVGGEKYEKAQLEQLVTNGRNYEAKLKAVANIQRERVDVESQHNASMAALQGVLTVMDQQLSANREALEKAALSGNVDAAGQAQLQRNMRALDDLERKLLQAAQSATPESLKRAIEDSLGDDETPAGPVSKAYQTAARAALSDDKAMDRYMSKRSTKATLGSMYRLMTDRYGMTAASARARIEGATAEDLYMFSDLLTQSEAKKAPAKKAAKVPAKKPLRKSPPGKRGSRPTTNISSAQMEKREKFADTNLGAYGGGEMQEFLLTGKLPDEYAGPRYTGV